MYPDRGTPLRGKAATSPELHANAPLDDRSLPVEDYSCPKIALTFCYTSSQLLSCELRRH